MKQRASAQANMRSRRAGRAAAMFVLLGQSRQGIHTARHMLWKPLADKKASKGWVRGQRCRFGGKHTTRDPTDADGELVVNR